MLVQKRKKTRKSFILWSVIGIVVAISAFFVYQNITSKATPGTPITITNITSGLPVPTDFGESLFSDPRFNAIANPENIKNQLGIKYTNQEGVDVLSTNTLSTPTDLSVFNPGYGGKLYISWKDASTDESNPASTTLFRSVSSSSGYEQIAFLGPGTTTYMDEDVTNGQTYYYRVKAALDVQQFQTQEFSIGSNDTTLGIRVDGAGTSGAVVSWNGFSNSDNPTEALQIRRIRDGVTSVLVTYTMDNQPTKITSASSFVDELSQNDDTYQVVGYSSFKESEYTNSVSGVPSDTIPPVAPTDVVVQNGGDGNSVVISWTNPLDSDFDYVKIYRSEVKGLLGQPIKTKRSEYIQTTDGCVKQTTEDQTTSGAPEGDCFINMNDLTDGNTYYYTLTSVDTSGNESPQRIISQVGRDNPFLPL